MGFDEELETLDRGLFSDHFNRLTEDVQDTLAAAESLAEFCYVSARDAKDPATAYVNETRSHVRELIDGQRHARGGRPPTPSTPWNQRMIAEGSASRKRDQEGAA